MRERPASIPSQPRVPAGHGRLSGRWTRLRGGIAPGQAARLTVAEAEAEDAIRQVRELDPFWHPTPGLIETAEGAIAQLNAEAREARERLQVLNRLVIESTPPLPSVSARSLEDILIPRGQDVGDVVRGAEENIRTVTRLKFQQIRDDLLVGARAISTPRSYNGLWFERPDGTRFGLRVSEQYGTTIDVVRSEHSQLQPGFKVHQK
ncbi:MAG: hypothetical protein HY659_14745 [Rhizobiales bacterium]|nr:hypothetical protein [Hyphomicrobiales bacterium]